MKAIILLMLIVFGNGCTAAPDQHPARNDSVAADRPMPAGGSGDGLENVDWLLRQYLGEAGELLAVLPETTVDARFSDGRIDGSTGCNRFFGTYTGGENNRLGIGPAATTRKHCAEPAGIMQQEQEYLDALARVHTYTLKPGILELRDENGSLQVNYRAR